MKSTSIESIDWMFIIIFRLGNQKCKEELLKDIADEKHFSRRMYYETKLEHFTHPIQQNAGEKYIELFLKNGAEINNQDSNGKTAYDEADFYGNWNICTKFTPS